MSLRIATATYRTGRGTLLIDIEAFDGDRPVGNLWAAERKLSSLVHLLATMDDADDRDALEECLRNIRALQRKVKPPPITTFVVGWVDLVPAYHGTGQGVAMYRAAARAAARLGGVLLPSLCTGGETSREALHVWFGERLGDGMSVEGFAVYGKT